MRGWFKEQSIEVRAILAAAGVALVALIVVAAVAIGGGGSSISDSAPCEDFVQADPGEQASYLESKLDALASAEEIAYAEGIQINCSKGYPNSTVIREFEATESEISEAEFEGADLREAITLIRQRREEREAYGEFVEEVEGD
jgi:hypothetical protein